MTAIEISGVSKRFTLRDEPVSTVKERMLRVGRRLPTRDFWALDDISLTVNPGETIGLLGHNGSGKSTLLKCVGGILQPTSGDIRTTGRVASLLELGAGFSPDLTGRENVFLNGAILGLSKRELEARLDDIVEFSELEEFIDNPVKTYSSGMHVRLGFAIAINVDPDILLVDEVLAVGDEAFQVRCLERVAQFQQEGRTIVVVTHSAEAVRQVCDRAAVLSRGRLIAEGHPDECIRRFRDSLAQKSAWYENPDAGTEVATSLRDLVTRFAVVDRVAVIGPSGIPDAPVEPGTPITIEIDVRADEPLADVVCSLALFDGGGRPIWGINTDQLQSLGTLEGSSRLRFEIDAVPLRCQQFTLAVTLHSRDQLTTHDVVEHGIAVQNGPLSVGIVHLEPHFSIDALAPISEPPSS